MLNIWVEKVIVGFVEMFDELWGCFDDDLGELVEVVLECIGYCCELEVFIDLQELVCLDNFNELVSVVYEFSIDWENVVVFGLDDEDVFDIGVLVDFLEWVLLVVDVDEILEYGVGVVILMILYIVKGLEFLVVFVIGWEDGMFLYMWVLDNLIELFEEWWLVYVGIICVWQWLYVSWVIVCLFWGQLMFNLELWFLWEILQEFIDWWCIVLKLLFSVLVSGVGWFGSVCLLLICLGVSRCLLLVFQVGDCVIYDKYGLGCVEEVFGVGELVMLLIDFGSLGWVKLMYNYVFVIKF